MMWLWQFVQELVIHLKVSISEHLYITLNIMDIDVLYWTILELWIVYKSQRAEFSHMVWNFHMYLRYVIENHLIFFVRWNQYTFYYFTKHIQLITSGHTDDFNSMLENLLEKYPNTRLVLVGFSLGGNLITKYLGEKQRNHAPNIIGGISICQGYNAIEWVSFYTH